MDAKKPLLLIEPLTESLKKLKEALSVSQAAEGSEDNFEIYVVNTISEAISLIPTIGPSLTICAAAKQSAQILQYNRPVMRRLRSKMILLSEKPLPPLLVTKLQKMGLTELIVEPIQPKTLLFKVKFFLKSLPLLSKLEEAQRAEKESVKKIKVSKDEMLDVNTEEKQRIEKGLVLDKYMGRDNSLKAVEDIKLDLIQDEKPLESKKEKVDSYTDLGSATIRIKKEKEIKLDLESEESEQVQKNDEPIMTEALKRQLIKNEEDIEFEIEAAAKEDAMQGIDLVDPFATTKVKKEESVQLDFEKESLKQKKEKIAEKSETPIHLKKDDPILFDLSDDPLAKDELPDALDIMKKAMKLKEKKEEEISLELTSDSLDDSPASFDTPVDDLMSLKSSVDLPLEQAPKEKRTSTEITLELDDDISNKKKTHEEITLSLSKKEKKVDESLIEAIKKARQKNLEDAPLDLDLNADQELKEEESALELTADDLKLKEGLDANQLDDSGLTIKDQEELKLIDEEQKSSKDDASIALELEADALKRKKGEVLEETLDLWGKRKKQKEDDLLDFQDFDLKDEKNQTEIPLDESSIQMLEKGTELDLVEDTDLYGKKKKSKSEVQDDVIELKRSKEIDLNIEALAPELKEEKNNREIIETKWINKKYKREINWDELFQKKKENIYELDQKLKKERGADEIFSLKRKNVGEQTIDYRKFKTEYDKLAEELKSQIQPNEKLTPIDQKELILDGLAGLDQEQTAEESFFDEMATRDEIYTVDTKGIEHAVRVLSLYEDTSKKPEEILKEMATVIYKETGGLSAFFYWSEDLGIQEAYVAHLELDESTSENARRASFNVIKGKGTEGWMQQTLPKWKDESFQALDQEFIFPYYEGISRMGFAVVLYQNGMKESKNKIVETILESCRGVFVNNLHRAGIRGRYNEEQKKKNKVVGFFTKMFGKKAS